jgi:hypothetical protein
LEALITGRIGVIAAIGPPAIRIIGACRRSAGCNSDGCTGGQSRAAVIGAVTSTIAADDGASTIAANDGASTIAAGDGASTIAASDSASTIAAGDSASTITAAAAERRAAAATEAATAAAERRATATTEASAATAERVGVRAHGNDQQAKANQ